MEHEFEAAHGLPEPLPAGERIVWQGSPDFRTMAARCFHVRTLTFYFGLILLARAATVWGQGGSLVDAGVAALWLAPPAVCALGLLVLMAYLSSRTSVYTITDRRVVMRIGIVLTVTYNIPFTRIDAAAVSLKAAPAGDIALTLAGPDRIAYLHLWPHARPWRLKQTEPSLRCVADAAGVGSLLAAAWREARGVQVPAHGADAQAASHPAAVPALAAAPFAPANFENASVAPANAASASAAPTSFAPETLAPGTFARAGHASAGVAAATRISAAHTAAARRNTRSPLATH